MTVGLLMGADLAANVALGLGTGSVGVLVTVALLKWRTAQVEAKNAAQDVEVKATSAALSDLSKAMAVQTSSIKTEILQSEKRTDLAVQDVTKTISRRLDSLRDVVGEQGTAIAVLQEQTKNLRT